MVRVHLTGKITEDRRLIVELPNDIPAGEVQITLEAAELPSVPNKANARAKLAAAGALSTVSKAPAGTLPPTQEELVELGALPSGSPSVLDLIDADRGAR